jgi:hypothetical protein
MLCCGVAGSGTGHLDSDRPSRSTTRDENPPEPPPNEIESDGLVLLVDSVRGWNEEHGGYVTGTVENRRRRKAGYVQISFNLYDRSGAQIGSAFDNVTGLEPGGRWKFKALAIEKFATYKFSELEGY